MCTCVFFYFFINLFFYLGFFLCSTTTWLLKKMWHLVHDHAQLQLHDLSETIYVARWLLWFVTASTRHNGRWFFIRWWCLFPFDRFLFGSILGLVVVIIALWRWIIFGRNSAAAAAVATTANHINVVTTAGVTACRCAAVATIFILSQRIGCVRTAAAAAATSGTIIICKWWRSIAHATCRINGCRLMFYMWYWRCSWLKLNK